jgi:hypothetical protein
MKKKQAVAMIPDPGLPRIRTSTQSSIISSAGGAKRRFGEREDARTNASFLPMRSPAASQKPIQASVQ